MTQRKTLHSPPPTNVLPKATEQLPLMESPVFLPKNSAVNGDSNLGSLEIVTLKARLESVRENASANRYVGSVKMRTFTVRASMKSLIESDGVVFGLIDNRKLPFQLPSNGSAVLDDGVLEQLQSRPEPNNKALNMHFITLLSLILAFTIIRGNGLSSSFPLDKGKCNRPCRVGHQTQPMR